MSQLVGSELPGGQTRSPGHRYYLYKAAAYAAFRDKQLPTVFQWEKAARSGLFTYYSGYVMPWGPIDVTSTVDTRANFKSGGTTPVGSFEFGMSPFGTYDMAGNVAEWCANQTTGGFMTAGASWDDLSYVFPYFGEFPGFTASGKLGFRCVLNPAHVTGNQGALRIDTAHQIPVYAPSTDATFRAVLSHYRYDKPPLDARVVEVKDTDEWRREKITYIGASDERALAYLYLPKNVSKPFQVIQFVPAGDVYGGYTTVEATERMLSPHIRSGRAVFAVVFKHFKERDRPPDYVQPKASSVKRHEELVNDATDLRRGLDYLQTRHDIDSSRIAYFGFSQGASEGINFTAVEDRYRSVVLVAGGMFKPRADALPEVSAPNFASHIAAPKLLLNGRYDEVNTLKLRVEPLFKLLRERKKLVPYDGSHTPPIEIAVPIVNGWLDETMGKVRPD